MPPAPPQETRVNQAPDRPSFLRRWILPLLITAASVIGIGMFSQTAMGAEMLKKVGDFGSDAGRRGRTLIAGLLPAGRNQQLLKKLDQDIQKTNQLEKFMKQEQDRKLGLPPGDVIT